MSAGVDGRGPDRVQLSPAEAELAERSLGVIVDIRFALLEAASAYTSMAPGERDLDVDERAGTWRLLERLGGLRREADMLGLDALGDDFLPAGAETLLAALEDSMAIALSPDRERTTHVLSVDEVVDRALALEEQGLWGR